MNSFKVFRTPLIRPKEVSEILGCNYNALLKEMREGNVPYVTINGSNYVEVGKWKVTRSMCDFPAQTVTATNEQTEKDIDPMAKSRSASEKAQNLNLRKGPENMMYPVKKSSDR